PIASRDLVVCDKKSLVAVLLPLDHLDEVWPKKLRDARVGALLHPASVSSKLEHASRVLERSNGDLFRLAAFFGPQHGFLGQTQDNMVEWQSYEHPRLRIPVHSLYGEHREPPAEMLSGLDVLLVDLQDIDKQNIEAAQHFRWRLAMFAVKAVNRYAQTGMLVTLPFDHVVLR